MNNKSYIYLWEGTSLYIGGRVRTNTHEHHALQIGVSLDAPFSMRIGEDTWKKSQGIIIAPDSNHECEAPNQEVIYMSIDPETKTAKKLIEAWLSNKEFDLLPDNLILPFADKINTCLKAPEEVREITKAVDTFINSLYNQNGITEQSHLEIDKRIVNAISILKESIAEPPKLNEISKLVGLSEGRLVHLFKQEVGIPMRRYILWLRLNNAFVEMLKEKNLTTVALKTGFSDSAHFSRIFTKNFGITPSAILKNSQIIQAFHISQ